jgi:hypothetical protein
MIGVPEDINVSLNFALGDGSRSIIELLLFFCQYLLVLLLITVMIGVPEDKRFADL